jgi:hypothetical protein
MVNCDTKSMFQQDNLESKAVEIRDIVDVSDYTSFSPVRKADRNFDISDGYIV